MFLARALSNISRITTNSDRQQVLAKMLKNPEKLGKTMLRIEFLTACRRAKVSPRFITDALKPVDKIFGDNSSIQSRSHAFKNSLLNEAISETFRTKAYLLRQRDRLFSDIETFLNENHLSYVSVTCGQVYDITIQEHRPRLVQKFQKLVREEAASERSKSPTPQKRVNNLSSLALADEDVALLSKGPNFALTQKITSGVILEAKKGVERLAYAKRWQDAIRRANEAKKDCLTFSHHPNPTTPTITARAGTVTRSAAGVSGATGHQTASADPEAGVTERAMSGTLGTRSASRTAPDNPITRAARGAAVSDSEIGASAGTPTDGSRTEKRATGAKSKTGLAFSFPDNDKRYPPPSSRNVECTLKQLKEDIVKSYQSHKITQSNVSSEQVKFLDELKKNDDVVIKQSDKCKGLVLMDKTVYLDKSQAILRDSNNYETIDKNPVAKLEAETRRLFKSVTKDKLPEKTVKELTPCHSRTPVFYGVPKDHKETVPLRPVISACGGPTEKMSCLLERVLKQLLKFVPTHLWDTNDFLTRLNKHSHEQGIPKDAIFFSIDVVNLYGSIPIPEAIEAVCDTLQAHLQEIDTFGLNVNDIRKLLEHSLEKSVCSFDGEFYRQTLGIAMGNPCAPPIAILFLDRFERRACEEAPIKPAFLTRYIDDYAGVWTHSEQSLLEFVTYLNSLHPTVKFTLEHSAGGRGVPFLDTLVTVEEHNGITKVETELYIKPMNSGIILHYQSAHPTSTKHSVARNQFKRAIRNSSNALKQQRSVEKIRNLLLSNGYPRKLVGRLSWEAKAHRTRIQNRKSEEQKRFDGYLSLPYIDEQLLCKVKSKVKKSGLNVRIAWFNQNILKKKLVRSSLQKPKCPGGQRCHTCKSGFSGDCTQKNVVYELSCNICHEQGQKTTYIGETKRPVRLRFNEHYRDVQNETEDSPMGDHFRESHPQAEGHTVPLSIRILYRASDHPDRKLAESLLIQKNHPQLNNNLSSWPIL